MPYTEELCASLLKFLDHSLEIPTNQFAGHVGNAAFWMGEVSHRVKLIEGYSSRFHVLKSSQRAYESVHGQVDSWSLHMEEPIPQRRLRKTLDGELGQDLRQRLLDAGHAFIDRALHEKLVSEEHAAVLRESILT
jgi:hypothetical protein